MTGNIIWDTQEHLHDVDKREQESDYKCEYCECGFHSGNGVLIGGKGGQKFCNECVTDNKHIIYYRDVVELKDSDTMEIISQIETI